MERHVSRLLALLFHPADDGRTFIRNVGEPRNIAFPSRQPQVPYKRRQETRNKLRDRPLPAFLCTNQSGSTPPPTPCFHKPVRPSRRPKAPAGGRSAYLPELTASRSTIRTILYSLLDPPWWQLSRRFRVSETMHQRKAGSKQWVYCLARSSTLKMEATWAAAIRLTAQSLTAVCALWASLALYNAAMSTFR